MREVDFAPRRIPVVRYGLQKCRRPEGRDRPDYASSLPRCALVSRALGARRDRAALSAEIDAVPAAIFAREYLTINPLGTVPCLTDGEVWMTELAAICQYLADRYVGPPLAVAKDEPDFGSYLNALHFGEATLTFPLAIVLRYSRFEPPEKRLPQAVADYRRWTLARMRAFESVLAGAEHVAAGRFTVADISVGYALMLAEIAGLGEATPPSLRAYLGRLSARPAFERAQAAQADAPDPFAEFRTA